MLWCGLTTNTTLFGVEAGALFKNSSFDNFWESDRALENSKPCLTNEVVEPPRLEFRRRKIRGSSMTMFWKMPIYCTQPPPEIYLTSHNSAISSKFVPRCLVDPDFRSGDDPKTSPSFGSSYPRNSKPLLDQLLECRHSKHRNDKRVRTNQLLDISI